MGWGGDYQLARGEDGEYIDWGTAISSDQQSGHGTKAAVYRRYPGGDEEGNEGIGYINESREERRECRAKLKRNEVEMQISGEALADDIIPRYQLRLQRLNLPLALFYTHPIQTDIRQPAYCSP